MLALRRVLPGAFRLKVMPLQRNRQRIALVLDELELLAKLRQFLLQVGNAESVTLRYEYFTRARAACWRTPPVANNQGTVNKL